MQRRGSTRQNGDLIGERCNGIALEQKAYAMWLMSDAEALAIIALVALIVALAVG